MTPTEQIKEKINIVEFIGSYIPLKNAGRNYKANCPFHGEKTPSFIVSPERQTWHCFGSCAEGGDIFKFLMKYENIEFYEALQILAERAGIELKKISPTDQKQFGILYDINECAKSFYKKKLENSAKMQKYLLDRGLTKETMEEFELGFAPQGFEDLTLDLINLGFDIKDVERAGLNFKTEKGGYMDRFRGRIMFPLYNHFGKVVGFSGRILPEYDNGETGKYINSPETPIFNKSKLLYGFHKSKNFIHQEKKALLVEGQMDFLMSYQDGVKFAVATSGTALTEDHLITLRKQTDELIFSFDNDEAGIKAAERSIELANKLDFNVRILSISKYKDPAEVVSKEPGLMKTLVEQSKPSMEFYFDKYLRNTKSQQPTSDNIGEFKKNIRIVLSKLKAIASPIEKAHWIKELSGITNINEQTLYEEIDKLKETAEHAQQLQPENFKIQNRPLSRIEMISERILTLILIKDSLKEELPKYMEFLPDRYKQIYKLLVDIEEPNDPQISALANQISAKASMESEKIDPNKIDKEFSDILFQLRQDFLKEKQAKVMKIIKEAEREKNDLKRDEALGQFDEIAKMLQNSI